MYRQVMVSIGKACQLPFIFLIRGYQLFISPMLGPRCRFYPSCSEYSLIAIRRHGVIKGGWLMVKRIGRCHPLCEGGVDLVPNKKVKG